MIFHDRRMIGPSSALKEHLSIIEDFKDILGSYILMRVLQVSLGYPMKFKLLV